MGVVFEFVGASCFAIALVVGAMMIIKHTYFK